MPLQIRRGLQVEKENMSIPLAAGELLYVTDTQQLYIGNGTTLEGVLVTGYSDEEAQDAIAKLLLGIDPAGTPDNTRHSGITFEYNDVVDRLDATVDFSSLSVVEANAFKGSLFADDSGLLVDAVTGSINLNGTVKGNIIPDVSATRDLGGPSLKFKDLYLSGNISGNLIGDVTGSVFADDSSLIVNAIDVSLNTAGLTIQNNLISATTRIILEGGGGNDSQVRFNLDSKDNPTAGIEAGLGISSNIDLFVLNKDNSNTAINFVGGEITGSIFFKPFQSDTALDFPNVVGFQADPAGTTSDTHIPGKFFVVTQPDTSAGQLKFMTFDSFGRLAINQETAQATVDINGFMKLAVLTTEPASPANGMVAIADGTSWDPLANGKQSMVVRLGGTWRELAAAA